MLAQLFADIGGGAVAGGGAALALVAVFLMVRLLAGGKATVRGGRLVMRYNLAFRLLGIGSLVAGAAGLLVLGVRRVMGLETPAESMALWCFLGFWVLPGVLIVTETFRRQVVLTDEGLSARGWFGWGPQLAWDQVRRVERVGQPGLGYRACGRKKAVVEVSFFMTGLNEFVGQCRERLDAKMYGDT